MHKRVNHLFFQDHQADDDPLFPSPTCICWGRRTSLISTRSTWTPQGSVASSRLIKMINGKKCVFICFVNLCILKTPWQTGRSLDVRLCLVLIWIQRKSTYFPMFTCGAWPQLLPPSLTEFRQDSEKDFAVKNFFFQLRSPTLVPRTLRSVVAARSLVDRL